MYQIYGDFKLLLADHPTIFAYTRTLEDGSSALVVMNFSTEPVSFTKNIQGIDDAHLLLSNYPLNEPGDRTWSVPTILRGYEGRVYLKAYEGDV